MTKAGIIEASDHKTKKIRIPEWNDHVFIRTLTGAEHDAFEEMITGPQQKMLRLNFRGRFAALVLCDENGDQLFTTDADIQALGQKSTRALDRIITAGRRLNRLTAADIKELEGNSEGGPSDASGLN